MWLHVVTAKDRSPPWAPAKDKEKELLKRLLVSKSVRSKDL